MASSAKEPDIGEETAMKRPRLQNQSSDNAADKTVINNSSLGPTTIENSWIPSCGEASCASVDSGLDDVSTPPPSLDDVSTPPPSLDDVSTPPPSASTPPPSRGFDGSPTPCEDDNNDDNMSDVSAISGLSDMSGQEWKPNMKRGLAWLHRAMATGADPRAILMDLLPGGSQVPEGIDNVMLWKVLFNLLSEPPRREKLADVNTLEDVVRLIRSSNNVLVLTGAGVSVSCGIPDFRSKDGVYARLAVDFPDLPDPQSMFDIKYFRKDPRPFFKFAREIYPGQFRPSPCHRFIQNIEAQGKLLRNYTQNIDTLEQVAGITRVIQCHGSFATASCTMCKHKVECQDIREDIFKQTIPLCRNCPKPDMEKILENLSKRKEESSSGMRKRSHPAADTSPSISPSSSPSEAPGCSNSAPITPPTSSPTPRPSSSSSPTPGPSTSSSAGPCPETEDCSPFSLVPVMKPDIVFFGEGLPEEFHSSIARDKENVDLLIVIGSSLKVRPVALVPSSIPEHVPQILINREPLPHLTFDVELLGDCDAIVNQLCLMLGEGWSSPVHSGQLKQHDGIPEAQQEKEGVSEAVHQGVPVLNKANGGTQDAKNGIKSTDEDNVLKNSPGEESISVHEKGDEERNEKSDSIDDTKDNDNSEHVVTGLASRIPEGHFLYLRPARYVFSGAEVTADSSDEDEDEDMDSDNNEEKSEAPEAGSGQGPHLPNANERQHQDPQVSDVKEHQVSLVPDAQGALVSNEHQKHISKDDDDQVSDIKEQHVSSEEEHHVSDTKDQHLSDTQEHHVSSGEGQEEENATICESLQRTAYSSTFDTSRPRKDEKR